MFFCGECISDARDYRKLDGDRRWAENASLTSASRFRTELVSKHHCGRMHRIDANQPPERVLAEIELRLHVLAAALKTSLRTRVSRSCLNFRDLLVVPHRVQRYVDQPLIRVQRIEHRHRMLDGKLL